MNIHILRLYFSLIQFSRFGFDIIINFCFSYSLALIFEMFHAPSYFSSHDVCVKTEINYVETLIATNLAYYIGILTSANISSIALKLRFNVLTPLYSILILYFLKYIFSSIILTNKY